MSGPNAPAEQREERRLQGFAVSPGVSRGIAYVHRPGKDEVPRYPIPVEQVDPEILRLEAALGATRAQITQVQSQLAAAVGAKEASIFDAHLLVLEDATLLDDVVRGIEQDHLNAEFIVHRAATKFAAELAKLKDPYLSERSQDITDVARRIIQNLTGKAHPGLSAVHTRHVLVAHHLMPSDTASLNRDLVLGFATEVGTRNSHTAILARSLGIPAVSGLHGIESLLETGDDLLLDGYRGLVVLNPQPATLQEYEEFSHQRRRVEQDLGELRETASTTRDGHHITLAANLARADDLPLHKLSGAQGVGLYRTEVFFFNRDSLPTEEEQLENYGHLARELHPQKIIIRTLDVGGDKPLDCLPMPEESNPFLGLRGVRLCLENPDIFKTQLRAILRASVGGNVRIMYPMVTSPGEVRRANALLDECRHELRAEGHPFDERLEVGVMIEVPAAALCAEEIARDVQFMSIGTNDLVQYTLAVDRLNDAVASLYEPTHPAVLRLIRHVVGVAHVAGLWVGVCGEMASDIVLVPLLLGLGIDELSAAASLVPRIKRAVQTLEIGVCRELAARALGSDSAADTLKACESLARERYGELLS